MKISELDENGQYAKEIPLPRGNRHAYVDTDMLMEMPWIKGEIIKSVNNLTIIKSESDFVMISTLKLLYALTRGQLTFGDLYYQSGIRMKKSFLEYLNFCVGMKFIKKMNRTGINQYYMINSKGHELLDMFYIK